MGVTLMENFEIGDPTVLTQKGWSLPSGQGVSFSIQTQTENGVARKFLRQSIGNPLVQFFPIGIPIPASKAFYLSFRLRSQDLIRNVDLRFHVVTNTAIASINSYAIAYATTVGAGGKWRLQPGGTDTGEGKIFDLNTWVTVEVLRDATGTTRVWLDDILLYKPGVVPTAPAANFVYIGWLVTGTNISKGANSYWDISDVVVVDPATPGLQNRPGSKSRVVPVPFVSDVSAQWDAPAGVTAPHYSLMADYPAAVDTAKVLTGETVGDREQYQAAALPQVVTGADQVLSVQIEQRAANAGGVPHAFATEVNVGSGNVEVAQNQLAGLEAFSYRPVYLDKKPDGTNWTAADVAAMKAGFTIKS